MVGGVEELYACPVVRHALHLDRDRTWGNWLTPDHGRFLMQFFTHVMVWNRMLRGKEWVTAIRSNCQCSWKLLLCTILSQ
jgi:hypothetical protein